MLLVSLILPAARFELFFSSVIVEERKAKENSYYTLQTTGKRRICGKRRSALIRSDSVKENCLTDRCMVLLPQCDLEEVKFLLDLQVSAVTSVQEGYGSFSS